MVTFVNGSGRLAPATEADSDMLQRDRVLSVGITGQISL
jgi:hypothetical protein